MNQPISEIVRALSDTETPSQLQARLGSFGIEGVDLTTLPAGRVSQAFVNAMSNFLDRPIGDLSIEQIKALTTLTNQVCEVLEPTLKSVGCTTDDDGDRNVGALGARPALSPCVNNAHSSIVDSAHLDLPKIVQARLIYDLGNPLLAAWEHFYESIIARLPVGDKTVDVAVTAHGVGRRFFKYDNGEPFSYEDLQAALAEPASMSCPGNPAAERRERESKIQKERERTKREFISEGLHFLTIKAEGFELLGVSVRSGETLVVGEVRENKIYFAREEDRQSALSPDAIVSVEMIQRKKLLSE